MGCFSRVDIINIELERLILCKCGTIEGSVVSYNCLVSYLVPAPAYNAVYEIIIILLKK